MGVESSNQIDLVVSEKGVSQTAQAVVLLADGADRAESSLGRLKDALAEIKASGFSELRAALDSARSGTDELKASTASYSASQKEAAAASQSVTKSLTTEATATRELKAQKAALVQAEAKASLDRKRYAAEMLQQYQSAGIAEAKRIEQIELQSQAEASLQAQMEREIAITEARTAAQLELAKANEFALAYHDAGIQNKQFDSNLAAQAKEAAAAKAELNAQIAAQQKAEATLAAEVKAEADAQATLLETYAALAEYRTGSVVQTTAETQAFAAETGEIDILQAAYRQLAEATAQLNEAKAFTRQIQSAVADGYLTEDQAINANAVAMKRASEATEQLQAAKANLAEVIDFENLQVIQNIELTDADTAAKLRNVSANVGAAGAIGLVEGRALSFNRVLANFLTKTLGLGGFFQAVFPFIGAVAAVAVIYQVYEAFDKWEKKAMDTANQLGKAFTAIIDPLRQSNDEMEKENDVLQRTIDKLEHKPTQNGTKIALDEIIITADKLSSHIQTVENQLDALLNKNKINALQAFVFNLGSTGDVENLIRSQFDNVDKIRNEAQLKLDADKRALSDLSNNPAIKGQAKTDAQNAILKRAQDDLSDGQKKIQKATDDATGALNGQYNALSKINKVATTYQTLMDENGANRTTIVTADQTANLTALGKGVQLMQEMARGQGLIYDNALLTATSERLKDVKQNTTLATEAARKQWKDVLAAFNDYQIALREANHGVNITAQDKLLFFQERQNTLLPANKDKGTAEINKYQTQIANESFPADQLQKLKDEAANMTLYGDALRETAMLDKILQEAESKHIPITDEMKQSYAEYIKIIVEGNPAQRLASEMIKQASLATNEYALTQAAGKQAIKDYPQFADEITEAMNRESESFKNAKDPLRQFNKSISDAMELQNEYGTQLAISQKLQALQNQNIAAGHALTQAQLTDERARLVELEHANELHAQENALYYTQADALEKLKIQREAINKLHGDGKLNDFSTKQNLVINQNAQNETQANLTGGDKAGNYFASMIAGYLKIEQIGAQVKDTLKQTFKELADGTADALSRAIVYGENLGQALKDVGRQALASLLSALVKIGIQLAVIEVLSKVFHINMNQGSQSAAKTASNTAVAVASIAAITAAELVSFKLLEGPAWSLAEAVSLASFGANAIGAVAGLAAVQTAGQAAQHFRDGGLVLGSHGAGTDTVPAWLTPGEYVLNPLTTARLGGASQLDAIQRGASNVSVGSHGTSTPAKIAAQRPLSVNVIHDGSTAVQVVPGVSEDEVHVIARNAVYQHADNAIGQSINNPNSRSSKSIKRNVTAGRLR